MDPFLLMTVQNFASHLKLLFLNKFYQLYTNIDPVTSCDTYYLRQTTDACWGKNYLNKPFTEGVKYIFIYKNVQTVLWPFHRLISHHYNIA